jgi:enoyl-CoA hydratase/carnithine racemase
MDRVLVDINDGVADVRLNRPDKRNALDMAMFDAIIDAAEALKVDPAVRAVVLSGVGASFCAGLDMSIFSSMAGDVPGERPAPGRGLTDVAPGTITHRAQQAVHAWREVPAPVIAALHGHALGGGLQIAVAADIRFCHPATQLSVLEIRWGLVPDMTVLQYLPALVGLDRAKELTYTGRIISGADASAMGLVTHLSDAPHTAALALAAEIAGKSPDAVRAAKRLLDAAGHVSIADGFAAERREIDAIIGSPNQTEAVRAWFEKRPAVFAEPLIH